MDTHRNVAMTRSAQTQAQDTHHTPTLLTIRQAAELLQVQETTLEQWRWQGKGPLLR